MHFHPSVLLRLVFPVFLLLSGYVQSMKAEQWKQRSIYQVLTDRFAPSTAQEETLTCVTAGGQYCGGSWQGIIRRLDYIQGMGFDAIWISPITKQIDNYTTYGQAFHGYWQQDMYSLNPHFGSSSDLLALSQALHARGMALMVDVVVNHFGAPDVVDYASYTPFNDGSYFHQETFITDYSNQTLVEQGWLGDSDVPLPDLDTENPAVVSTLNSWISSLIQTYQIDGLRLDTVKHVRKDFWPGFVSSSDVFCLGEVLSGDPNYLSSYQSYVGGLLDYGTYYPLLRAFTPGGDMHELMSLTAPSYRALFTDTQLLATFMENHDQPRFPSSTSSDATIVKSAMAYTLLSDGIPIIYYGQEQSFNGGADPNNREALWPTGYSITPLYKYLSTLNQARKLAWGAGFGTNLTTGLYVDSTTTVSQKGPLLLVLSNLGSGAAVKSVTFPSQFAAGTILVNVLTCQSILVGKSTSNVTITAGAPQVYLPLGLAQQMCSNIAAPIVSSSVLSKIASIFTSSSKTAARSATRSSQTTYSSGTRALTTTGLALNKPSTPTSAPPVPPSAASTLDSQSIFHSSTSPAAAVKRPGFTIAAQSPSSTSTTGQPTSSRSASVTSSQSRPGVMTAVSSTTVNPVVSPTISTSSRATTSPTVTKQQRPGFVIVSPSAAALQKRVPGNIGTPDMRSPTISPRPHTPQQQQLSQSRKQSARQTTTPPASFSQHYRADRSLYTTPPSGLSATYSYSASHLPLPGKLSENHRSSSDNSLSNRAHHDGPRKGHTAQSRSMHNLKKRGSSNSLSGTTNFRANSFAGGVPLVPPITQRLDTRAALFAEDAPYVHTSSLSSVNIPLPPVPRQRRGSNGSIRSVYSLQSNDPRSIRHAPLERQNLLAQEHGVPMPYMRSGSYDHLPSAPHPHNEVMGSSIYGQSRASLVSHHADGPIDTLPLHRRMDHRVQLQEDVRHFRV